MRACVHSCLQNMWQLRIDPLEAIIQSYSFSKKQVFGSEYVMVCGHALQATHNIVYAHRAILPFVSSIKTHAVSTGFRFPGRRLGNKGGIGISFNVGATAMIFVNAHLTHGKEGYAKRNAEYVTITAGLARALIPGAQQTVAGLTARQHLVRQRHGSSSRNESSEGGGEQCVGEVEAATPIDQAQPLALLEAKGGASSSLSSGAVDMSDDTAAAQRLLEWFDVVVWGGDLNYRLDADRATVS